MVPTNGDTSLTIRGEVLKYTYTDTINSDYYQPYCNRLLEAEPIPEPKDNPHLVRLAGNRYIPKDEFRRIQKRELMRRRK